ncbi:MAG: hypothetical protein CM15mV149_090 [uncultured marine virus]|nr:MAG: hypothetical protein CM15mV149_090 [uncultured marine virus]
MDCVDLAFCKPLLFITDHFAHMRQST